MSAYWADPVSYLGIGLMLLAAGIVAASYFLKEAFMTPYEDDDQRFPDGLDVLTPFPVTDDEAQGDRASWPWLPATVVSRCGPDEWSVCIEAPAAVTLDEDGEPLYPVVFRDASEIRLPDPSVEELREIFFRDHGGEGGFMP